MAEKLSSQEDSASEGYARENSILASLLPRLSFGKQCIFSQLSDGKTKGGKKSVRKDEERSNSAFDESVLLISSRVMLASFASGILSVTSEAVIA